MISWLTLPLLSLSTAQADAISLGIRGGNSASEPLAERLDAGLAIALDSREQLQALRVDPYASGEPADFHEVAIAVVYVVVVVNVIA